MRTAAKLTQRIYGTMRYPAFFEMPQNALVVAAIESQRSAMMATPAQGERRPKKAIDHAVFSASWVPKRPRAERISFFANPFSQTKYAAIPINK